MINSVGFNYNSPLEKSTKGLDWSEAEIACGVQNAGLVPLEELTEMINKISGKKRKPKNVGSFLNKLGWSVRVRG